MIFRIGHMDGMARAEDVHPGAVSRTLVQTSLPGLVSLPSLDNG